MGILNKIWRIIQNIFLNVKNLKILSICLLLTTCSSFALISSGATNPDTKTYQYATTISNLIKSDEKVKNVAIVVEEKEKNHVPDTATELRGLYGAFGNRATNYAGTINADKQQSITFADYDIVDNLSFVYIQTGVKVHENKNVPGEYRAEFYPLKFMFNHHANHATSFYSFLYLSVSQARDILNNRYPGSFDVSEDVKELAKNQEFVDMCESEFLEKGINIKFNDVVKNYEITNIYLEEDYFYDTVHRTIGDFLVGYNQYPEGFNKQATYFLNEYEYQNYFYLSYIKENYDKTNFNFYATSIHLDHKFNEEETTGFLENNSSTISILLLVASILFIVLSLGLAVIFKCFDITYSVYTLLTLIVPYLICYLFFKFTANLTFFAPFYCQSLLFVLLSLIILFSLSLFIMKLLKEKESL